MTPFIVMKYFYHRDLSRFLRGALGPFDQSDQEYYAKPANVWADAPKRNAVLGDFSKVFPCVFERAAEGSRNAVSVGIIAHRNWLGLAAWGFCCARTNGLIVGIFALAIGTEPVLPLVSGDSILAPTLNALPALCLVLLVSEMLRFYGSPKRQPSGAKS